MVDTISGEVEEGLPERYINFDELSYSITRLIECFCIALFIFGILWNTTELLKLTTPQFMILYGGVGALVTEIIARMLSKKKIKN